MTAGTSATTNLGRVELRWGSLDIPVCLIRLEGRTAFANVVTH